jgi:hypothetical protein
VDYNVFYEHNGKILYIPVLSSFDTEGMLIINNARMRFYGISGSFYLGLDLTGDGVADYTDSDEIVITDTFLRDTLAPYAPQNVNASYANNVVTITWNKPIDLDLQSRTIFRTDNNTSSQIVTEDIDPYQDNFIDTNTNANGNYTYSIYFLDRWLNRSPTSTISIVTGNNNVNGTEANTNAQDNANGHISGNVNRNVCTTCSCDIKNPCGFCCDNTSHFADVPSSFWAHDFIEYLYGVHVLQGVSKYGSAYFEPERTINRAEAVKVAVLALNKNNASYIHSTTPYLDTPDYAWFTGYISISKTLGLELSGGNYFYPAKNVTRAEALKILLNVAQIPIDDTLYTKHFSDVSQNNPFMKYIAYAYHHGMVEGYVDGTFRPDKEINRAEFSKLVLKLLLISNPTG